MTDENDDERQGHSRRTRSHTHPYTGEPFGATGAYGRGGHVSESDENDNDGGVRSDDGDPSDGVSPGRSGDGDDGNRRTNGHVSETTDTDRGSETTDTDRGSETTDTDRGSETTDTDESRGTDDRRGKSTGTGRRRVQRVFRRGV